MADKAKKSTIKKLELNIETLMTLTGKEQAQVNGGGAKGTYSSVCLHSQNLCQTLTCTI
jgi:hypothetical protein